MIKTILEENNKQTSQEQLTELRKSNHDLLYCLYDIRERAEKDRKLGKYNFFEYSKIYNTIERIKVLYGLIDDLLDEQLKK